MGLGPAPSVTTDVVVCPVCAHPNVVGRSHCERCWRRHLTLVEPVSADVANRIIGAKLAARRRQRLRRWGTLAAVVLGLVVWRLIAYFDPFLSVPPPTSTVTAVSGSGEWAMYQRSPSHSGVVADEEFLPDGRIRWTFEAGAALKGAPAVVGDRVYLGTDNRGMVALDRDSGELVWEYRAARRVRTTPAVAGGLVFVGLLHGSVIALNKDTGRLQWEFAAAQRRFDRIFSSPAVHEGTVYIGSGSGRIYALDAVTGQERWSYLTGDSIISSPAVNGEVVAVLSQDKNLYVIDADTGKRRFDYRMFFATGSPTIDGDRVLAGDDKGFLRAIDWHAKEFPFEKAIRTLRFHVFWYGFTDELPIQKGFIWGFQEPGHTGAGTPVAAHGRVYVGSASGTLFAVDATTGEKVWEFRAKASLRAPPAVVGDTVFVADTIGRLYVVDASTGVLLREIGAGGGSEAAPVVADGVVYLASTDGTLYAID